MVQFFRANPHLTQIQFVERNNNGNTIVWHHTQTGEFLMNTQPIEGLSPIQRRILGYLLEHQGVYLTKTVIINAAWPDDISRAGVSDDALFQQISALRKVLRQYSSQSFVVTWRGIPEGGYRFFSNGRLLPSENGK
ncbi:MAG: winged helix family transcriptional regulator [Chloroflexi bacterium]|nr:MAG: winged helix family transcriptional regulator [Chloroflexota bacterium]